MSKQLVGIILVVLSVFVSGAIGQTLSQEEQAFFQKHLPDVVRVEPKRLNDHAVVSVFAAPIYDFTVAIKMGDGGTSTQHVVVARVEDEFVPLSRPGQDGDYPGIQKMFRPGFKLINEDVAETFQRALDIVFPLSGQEKRAETFSHKGNEWTFVRGKFF